MSIEKITSKILDDAQNEANSVMESAKKESDAIIAEAETKAREIETKATEKGTLERDQMIERRKAVADIDGRKIVLEEKQKLIGECFDKAVDTIVSMDKEKYIAFLVETVKSTGMKEGELILNEKDRSAIGSELVEAISKAVDDSKIVLSDETKNIRGGFFLKKGPVFINGTVEGLVDESKETLIVQVAEKLF